MTESSPSLGATDVPAASPAPAGAQTDGHATRRPVTPVSAEDQQPVFTGEAPAGKTFWANLNSPFTLGLLITLGGLAALALGLAFWNLSTIIIYIVFALFAALGL